MNRHHDHIAGKCLFAACIALQALAMALSPDIDPPAAGIFIYGVLYGSLWVWVLSGKEVRHD